MAGLLVGSGQIGSGPEGRESEAEVFELGLGGPAVGVEDGVQRDSLDQQHEMAGGDVGVDLATEDFSDTSRWQLAVDANYDVADLAAGEGVELLTGQTVRAADNIAYRYIEAFADFDTSETEADLVPTTDDDMHPLAPGRTCCRGRLGG